MTFRNLAYERMTRAEKIDWHRSQVRRPMAHPTPGITHGLTARMLEWAELSAAR